MTKKDVVNVLLSSAEGFTFETLSFLASNNYYCHKNSALYRKLKKFKIPKTVSPTSGIIELVTCSLIRALKKLFILFIKSIQIIFLLLLVF